jgi:transitional endoplasmic reticulum ATPase
MTPNEDQARARINEILRQLGVRQQTAKSAGGWLVILLIGAWSTYWYIAIDVVWWHDIGLFAAAICCSMLTGAMGIMLGERMALTAASRRFIKSFARDYLNFRRARRALDDPDKPGKAGNMLSHALNLRTSPCSLYGGPAPGADPRTGIDHLLTTLSERDSWRRQFSGVLAVDLIVFLTVSRSSAQMPHIASPWVTLAVIAAIVALLVLRVVMTARVDLRRARRTIFAIYPPGSSLYQLVYSHLVSLSHSVPTALVHLLPDPSIQGTQAAVPEHQDDGPHDGSIHTAEASPPVGSASEAKQPPPRLRITPTGGSAGNPVEVPSPADGESACDVVTEISPESEPTPEGTTTALGVGQLASFLGAATPRKKRVVVQDPGFVEAIRIAYRSDITSVVSVLQQGFSALVCCDKIVVEHLWKEIVTVAGLEAVVLEVSDAASTDSGGLLQQQIKALKARIQSVDAQRVLVVPNLDLLAGGSSHPSEAAREFIEQVYRASSCVILAFSDPSLELPTVLSNRFSIRRNIEGVPKHVEGRDGRRVSIGNALIRPDEIAQIEAFDPEALYSHISGLNPIEIRRIVRYAIRESAEHVSMENLYETIRLFKANASRTFEVHDVKFTDIGGYEAVKAQLERAILLMEGHFRLPNEKLRRQLIPRGFLLYGPPGTGKTLFAKAVAHRLRATVAVVSGPEILEAYWGATERRIRELFAGARRNAPAVLVFDEFDAIAPVRSSGPTNSSHFMASIVAQILTEMDGFRADVPILVIGTTNRLELIDPAFLRPSRFQPIAIGLPDRDERYAIAKIHCEQFALTVSDETMNALAEATAAFSGDEIKSIFREACVAQAAGNLGEHGIDYELGRQVGQIQRRKEKRPSSSTVDLEIVSEAATRARDSEEAGMIPIVIRRVAERRSR